MVLFSQGESRELASLGAVPRVASLCRSGGRAGAANRRDVREAAVDVAEGERRCRRCPALFADLEQDGVMRWRRIDLKAVIEERFGIVYTVRSVSRILHDLGFSRMSARPRHPAQDRETVEAFKKISRPYWLPI